MSPIPARPEKSGFVDNPDYLVRLEPCGHRVRAVLKGETLVDTDDALVLIESGHHPVYYFRRDDLRMDLLERSNHHSFCPFKGYASYWTLRVVGFAAENAAWSYEDPFPEVADLKDLVALYWDRVDHWYSDGEEIFDHARRP